MKTVIKLIVAAVLFGCLAKMPYGYYQFVRIIGIMGFGWLAYTEGWHANVLRQRARVIPAVLSGICALLYNPFIPIHFTREIWNGIDLVLAIVLCVWSILDLLLHKKDNEFTPY